jgi:ABC-2 type transport system ATP-binding protein
MIYYRSFKDIKKIEVWSLDTIVLQNVSKKFKDKIALNNINIEIKGSFGLLGPNGAGKTTLMRILTTLIEASSGNIHAGSLDWDNRSEVRKHIGYLPQHFTMFKNVSVLECLNHLAVLKGIGKKERSKIIKEILEEVNLLDMSTHKIKHLSGGMLRRVGIAQTLLGDPKLLIVDEPTVGLDIEERVRFRNLLRKLGKSRNIVISTHIVEDIEATCDHICILKDGEVLEIGTKTSITSLVRGKVFEKLVNVEELDKVQDNVISTKQQGEKYLIRYFSLTEDEQNRTEPTLEDAYLYLTQRKDKQN